MVKIFNLKSFCPRAKPCEKTSLLILFKSAEVDFTAHYVLNLIGPTV